MTITLTGIYGAFGELTFQFGSSDTFQRMQGAGLLPAFAAVPRLPRDPLPGLPF